MQIFPEGYTVAYTVPLFDLNNQPIAPTSIDVRVENDRQEVLARIPVTVPAGEDLLFEVEGEMNHLGEGHDGIEGRFVVVTFHTEAGAIERRFVYMIKVAARLQAPRNSFQTLEQAIVTSYRLIGAEQFQAASDQLKENALAEAFLRITRIALKVAHVDPATEILPETRRWVDTTYISQLDWSLIDEARWKDFPRYFTDRLKRAQVVEANAILTSDPVGTKRRLGIISETTGESSMMFRNGFLDLGVSPRTVEELTGLVHYDFRITR